MTSAAQYWDARSTAAYEYRGERFYTITPIAYYYERRQRIVEHIAASLAQQRESARILDYGCGDGAYVRLLMPQYPLSYFGCDLSPGFISRAQHECGGAATFAVMQPARIPFDARFDCIYCVAVLAHILDDDLLLAALRDIRAHLSPGGVFCMAEATAWWRRSGATWTRRTPSQYARMLAASGFRITARRMLAYPLFFYYDALVLPLLRAVVFRGTREEKMLAVNRSPALRAGHDALLRVARHCCLPWLTPTHTTLITAVATDER